MQDFKQVNEKQLKTPNRTPIPNRASIAGAMLNIKYIITWLFGERKVKNEILLR